FDRALEEFRNVQQLTLERAHAHINLAWLERQLGKADASMEHLRSAIRLEPYLTGPRTDLANLLAGGSGDDAEIGALRREEAERLERDTALLPDGADIYYRLGLVRFQLGEYEAAAAAFERACELVPTNYQFRMALALLEERRYELDGDPAHYEAAIQSLDKLREIEPDAPQAEQILQRLRSTKQRRDAQQAP
ncbi:MAG TPA: tetratricopeptide repeat protein, partial [Lacipirellulaceae bacterium]|nr:tetratricopeptide repeat protein [Lacipirellulaceae bacterium]